MSSKARATKGSSAAKAVGYALFLILVFGVATVIGWMGRSSLLSKIMRNPNSFLNANPTKVFKKNSLNLLILGCDEDRYYHGTYANGQNVYRKYARSDMMLLTKLDFDTNTITGLSIPRDTMVRLPRRGDHKINAYHELAQVYHWGNPDQITKEAVEQMLGVDVDRVVVLNFDAFQQMINLVGGVDVDVPKAMNYDDKAGELHIHLKPGPQHLDGYDAMCFVRFRHDAESDFGRQQRQKELLMSFKQAAFRNIFKLPELADEGKEVINNAMDEDEIIAMAAFARKVPSDKIKMGMVPVIEGDGNYLVVDKRKLPTTLAEYGFTQTQSPQLSAQR